MILFTFLKDHWLLEGDLTIGTGVSLGRRQLQE